MSVIYVYICIMSSPCELQDMIFLMYDSFDKNGMKMNIGKMNVMVLEKNNEMNKCDIEIVSQKIKHVKQFKHLGCTYVHYISFFIWKNFDFPFFSFYIFDNTQGPT